ncbi:carbohydrate-binding domain-containing protein [Treponema putidum]|uniref:Carbohydrate-binding domain-containing protein n=1 Tax=Treponema putidum TaxID=221027 RepID=A0ABY5HZ49_9SPIR|nr:carbohydrate-binding domain-containing protein [Treponema putidum]UTY29400.1 carbohydrate-binding domain-containing protein [Treponema putidum]
MKINKKLVKAVCMFFLALSLLNCRSEDRFPIGRMEVNLKTPVQRDTSKLFSDKDFKTEYNSYKAVNINLSALQGISDKGLTVNGNTVTINAGGQYIISRSLKDGQIIIDAPDNDEVHIILDNADVSNSSLPVIYAKKAGKMLITLAKGSKTKFTVNEKFADSDADKIEAVIFSQADLTLNGTGELNIESKYGSGIVSKKDLRITGGTLTVYASKHALKGCNNVSIADGKFTLTAGKDGIHSENEENAESGNIYIKNGEFTINAESEALDAINDITIDGGYINIVKADEGMEAVTININGGKIMVVSSDDGLNASYSDKEEISAKVSGNTLTGDASNKTEIKGPPVLSESAASTYVNITGGELTVNSQTDGIDSNGSVYVSGGKVKILGPVSDGDAALDYDLTAVISGGEFIASGSRGMVQGFSDKSTQASFIANFSKTVKGEVVVTDSSGLTILKTNQDKDFQSIVISSKDLKVGETYKVTAGGQTVTVKLDSISAGDNMHRRR